MIDVKIALGGIALIELATWYSGAPPSNFTAGMILGLVGYCLIRLLWRKREAQ